MRKDTLRSMAAGLALVALYATPALAQKQKGGQNGTTLAAAKDLNICRKPDATPTDATDDVWRYYGNISVWQEGAQPTQGLKIQDWIQFKAFNSSGQFVEAHEVTVPMTELSIPAYTPEQSAVLFPYSFEGTALNGYIRNSAKVTITNHSGHLGTDFGPNPKFTYTGPLGLDVPVCNLGDTGGCAYSFGYWKQHRPGGTIEGPWTLENPGFKDPSAQFFYATKTVCISNCDQKPKDRVYTDVAESWAEAIDHSPAGSAYYQLAHQYIAAVLNVNNGATDVPGITGPGGILDQATAWFDDPTHTPASCGPSQCGTQGAWAELLEAYNTGGYADEGGPKHCGDDYSTIAPTPTKLSHQ